MPRPALTLWIFNAVTLPTVGLVVLLTPRAPTPPSNKLSQTVVKPEAKSSLNKPDPVKEPSLPPLPALRPLQPLAPEVQSLPKKLKPAPQSSSQAIASPIPPKVVPRREVTVPLGKSLPKKPKPAIGSNDAQSSMRLGPPPRAMLFQSRSANAPPSQPLSAPRRPSIRPRPEVVAPIAFSLPKKPQPAIRLVPPPKAMLFQSRSANAPASPPLASPSPPEDLPAPPVVVVAASPAQEPKVTEEVRSLCHKFPLNSLCKDIPQVAAAQISPEPERKLSQQEEQSLCHKFPLNSHCKNRPPVAVTEARSEEERKLSSEEVESLCHKFPYNSYCKYNNSAPETSAPAPSGTPTLPDSGLP